MKFVATVSAAIAALVTLSLENVVQANAIAPVEETARRLHNGVDHPRGFEDGGDDQGGDWGDFGGGDDQGGNDQGGDWGDFGGGDGQDGGNESFDFGGDDNGGDQGGADNNDGGDGGWRRNLRSQ